MSVFPPRGKYGDDCGVKRNVFGVTTPPTICIQLRHQPGGLTTIPLTTILSKRSIQDFYERTEQAKPSIGESKCEDQHSLGRVTSSSSSASPLA
jgi:hypothetical protein